MTKYAKGLINLVVGIALGAGIMFLLTSVFHVLGTDSNTDFLNVSSTAEDADIISLATHVVSDISSRNYEAMSQIAHPKYGVVFTPYSTVVLGSDKCFTANQIKKFGTENTKYIWGKTDGTGNPIEMTPAEYFDNYVYDRQYKNSPIIGVNTVVRFGNALENVMAVFPDAKYVDFNFPGTAEASQLNWGTLRLVFEDYDGVLRLTAIIHCEYTI